MSNSNNKIDEFTTLIKQKEYQFLGDYFSKHPEDLEKIKNHLSYIQESGTTLNKQEAQTTEVAEIILKAISSNMTLSANMKVLKDYNNHMRRLLEIWNKTLTETANHEAKTREEEVKLNTKVTEKVTEDAQDWVNIETETTLTPKPKDTNEDSNRKKMDQTVNPATSDDEEFVTVEHPNNDSTDNEDDFEDNEWIDVKLAKDKFISLEIAEKFKKLFIYKNFDVIFKQLHINFPYDEKTLERQWVASNIFEHFEFFQGTDNYSTEQKQKLIEECANKLAKFGSTITDEQIRIIIIECIHSNDLISKLNNNLPQEKLFVDAIREFNGIINQADAKKIFDLTGSHFDRKYYFINQLLECNEEHNKAANTWSTLFANLFGNKIGTSSKNLLGANKEKVKNEIYEEVQKIFEQSTEIQNEYMRLIDQPNSIFLKAKGTSLEKKLKEDLLKILALEAQKEQIPDFFNSNKKLQEDLYKLKKKFSFATMWLNIISDFKDLTLDKQEYAIDTLYDYVGKTWDSANTEANKIKELESNLKAIAIPMSSKLMLKFQEENKLDNKTWWEKCKESAQTSLKGAAQGFLLGLLLSRGNPTAAVAAAGMGLLKPKLMGDVTGRLTTIANILTVPFTYFFKEMNDIFRNPLGRSMVNRLIRGGAMVITAGALITAAVYAAPYVIPLVGSGGLIILASAAILGSIPIISGVAKLASIITGKIRPLARWQASSLAKKQLGGEAQDIISFLQDKEIVINKMLKEKFSPKEQDFLTKLKNDITQSVQLINYGSKDAFFEKWGNDNEGLKSQLDILLMLECNANVLSMNLTELSKKILEDWKYNEANEINKIFKENQNNKIFHAANEVLVQNSNLEKTHTDIANIIRNKMNKQNSPEATSKPVAKEQQENPEAISILSRMKKSLPVLSFGNHNKPKSADPNDSITPRRDLKSSNDLDNRR